MKYRLIIRSEFDDGSRTRLYYEIGEDVDQLKSVAGAFTKDEEFNKKIIKEYQSSAIIVSLEEMNEDGTWSLLLEYVDFL